MRITSIDIIKQLRAAGHQAYWAGGCVRDMLLGIKPKDFDIVTSAKPDEIEDLLEHTVPIGKQFGVILAIQNEQHFEVATFRSDAGYSDGRRPDAVLFTNAEEDAKRRDFTINALFYDPLTDKILDYVEGQKDLDAKLIRFIGNPVERIKEDHLRLLRAVRFKNVYKFQYHPETYKAVKDNIHLLKQVSPERLRDELNKMLISQNRVEALEDMEDLGILELLLPEIQALKGLAQPLMYHQEGDVFDHTMACLKAMPEGKPPTLYWAVMLHDSGKALTFSVDEERIRYDGHAEASAEIARKVLKRLNFSSREIKKVAWLCEQHMSVFNVLTMPEKARLKWFKKEWFLDLLALHKYDALGITPQDHSCYQAIRQLYSKQMADQPLEIKPFLTGEELMHELKLKPGPEVGRLLEELTDLQLAGEVKTKIQAYAWLKKQVKIAPSQL